MSTLTATRSTQPSSPAARAFNRYLLPFMILFAIALVSGLFYFFVPRTWNWTASQAALWIHLVSGIAGFFFLVPYVAIHYKDKGEDALTLLFLWRAFRPRAGEPAFEHRQRLLGHLLNWSMGLLGLSGLILTLPGVLWLAGVVWLAGYPAYQIANLTHFGLSLAALALIGLHLNRRRKKHRP